MLFSEYVEIRNNIEELNESSAQIIVEKDLDPQALNELADIILEFNPLALGGALGGAALGGIPGAMAGGWAGGKAGQGVSKWFKGGQNQQVAPALKNAKQAVGNLVNVLGAAGQANVSVDSLPKVQQAAQQLNQTLSDMDQDVSQIDKSWGQAQDSVRKSQGGLAQQTQRAGDAVAGDKKGGFRNWLGGAIKNVGNAMKGNETLSKQGGVRGAIAGMGDKINQWAAKHPRLAGAAKLGATGAAIGAAHAMGAGGGDVGGSDMAGGETTAAPAAADPDWTSSGASAADNAEADQWFKDNGFKVKDDFGNTPVSTTSGPQSGTVHPGDTPVADMQKMNIGDPVTVGGETGTYQGFTPGDPMSRHQLAKDFAQQMGIDPSNIKAQFHGGVPSTINGQPVPDELYTPQQKWQMDAAKQMRAAMSNWRPPGQ